MRVAIVAPFAPPMGGISRWSDAVTSYMRRLDPVEIFTVNTSPLERLSKPGRSKSTRFIAGVISLPRTIILAAKNFLRNRPQIVHISSSGGMAHIRDIPVLVIARLSGSATVLHLHHGRLGQTPNRSERIIVRITAILSDRVVCLDSSTLEVLRDLLPQNDPGSILVVPNPVAIERDIVPFSRRRKELVFVGWNLKTKGLDDLIEAWRSLGSKRGDNRLLVVGPGKEDYLRAYTQDIPSGISFLGPKAHADTLALISESLCLVLPSYSEGFPNVVLEAMSLATPVIATNVGAITEMLDGTGMVIDAGDLKSLTNSLASLVADPEAHLRNALQSRKRVAAMYSMEYVSDALIALWQDAAMSSSQAK